MQQVDIVHLSFKPPFAPGSYNRLAGMQVERLTGLRQAIISYWGKPVPENQPASDSLILVNRAGLSWRQQALLHLPEVAKKRWFNGISGKEGLAYFWQILRLLPRLKPKVVVCYENYQFGGLLRPQIDWPCRLVLNQHGLSYVLAPNFAAKVYSLASYDVIWPLTRAAYNYDRLRLSAYEPIVKILPNWIDLDNFTPVAPAEKSSLRARWKLPPDAPVVLWLSRLVPKKGAHVILQAWPKVLREFPNAFLWIIGGGEAEYAQYLRNLVSALKLAANVRLEGFVPPDSTASCYQAADVYVFPTLFNGEGFGLSLLEGMACGLPCVASDCEILRELYSDEVVLLVPDPNLEGAFTEPLRALLGDASLRRRVGQAARQFAEQHYHPEKVLPQIKEFYQQQIALAGGSQ